MLSRGRSTISFRFFVSRQLSDKISTLESDNYKLQDDVSILPGFASLSEVQIQFSFQLSQMKRENEPNANARETEVGKYLTILTSTCL